MGKREGNERERKWDVWEEIRDKIREERKRELGWYKNYDIRLWALWWQKGEYG